MYAIANTQNTAAAAAQLDGRELTIVSSTARHKFSKKNAGGQTRSQWLAVQHAKAGTSVSIRAALTGKASEYRAAVTAQAAADFEKLFLPDGQIIVHRAIAQVCATGAGIAATYHLTPFTDGTVRAKWVDWVQLGEQLETDSKARTKAGNQTGASKDATVALVLYKQINEAAKARRAGNKAGLMLPAPKTRVVKAKPVDMSTQSDIDEAAAIAAEEAAEAAAVAAATAANLAD